MSPAQEFYAEAQDLHRQGRLAEAEELYRKVLELHGEYAGALIRLGEVCFRQGHFEDAAAVFVRALKVAPNDPAVLGGYGSTLNQLGRFDDALVQIKAAIIASPDNVGLYFDLGNALTALGRVPEAVASYQRAAELDPGAQDNAQYSIGQALARIGRFDEAAGHYQAVLARQPGHIPSLANLAFTAIQLGRLDLAIDCYEKIIKHQPNMAHAYYRLADVLQSANRHDEAAQWYRRIVERDPTAAVAWSLLGRCLATVGKPAEAALAFDKAAALAPDDPAMDFERGNGFQLGGRFAEARQSFEKAIAKNPNAPAYWFALVHTGKVREDDPSVSALETMVQQGDAIAPPGRVLVHFALGKAYEDLDRPQEAFASLSEGNAIQRSLMGYDEAGELGMLETIARQFSADYLSAHKGAGFTSDIPVFIVGMPRSGTTLVEQILASHPNVFGAGEVSDLALIYDSIIQGSREPNGQDLWDIGKRYTERLRRKAPDALRITNKLPSNFASVGLIHAALPKARIIHIKRDPLDTCFSCFSKLFESGHLFTYNQEELGRYYRAYEKLMAHWHAALPPLSMLEVSYETLIGDFEAEARRIVAFCGLEWDGACLAFHRTERPIGTASAFQVRQPLYKTAIGRAQAYRPWLGPLLDALKG